MLFVSLGFAGKSGAVEFKAPADYPVGTNPSAALRTDSNDDGKLDA